MLRRFFFRKLSRTEIQVYALCVALALSITGCTRTHANRFKAYLNKSDPEIHANAAKDAAKAQEKLHVLEFANGFSLAGVQVRERLTRRGYIVFPDKLKLRGHWLPTLEQRNLRSPGGQLGKIYSSYRGLPSRPRLCVWPGEGRDDPAKISRCVMISQKADEFYLGDVADGYFHGQGTLFFTRGVLGPLSELFIFQGEFRYGWPFAGRIFCKRPAREVCEVFAAIFHGPISVELVDSFGLFQDETALLLPELQEATGFLKTL